MNERGEHAVVLGVGIAGLLAARVLSAFYDSVTIDGRPVGAFSHDRLWWQRG
jgi:predicted NAD/FAD-dependent oxidoreductase